MSLYLKRHDGDAATIEDFIKCFEDAAKIDLSQFSLWYSQAGTPHLHLNTEFQASKKQFVLEIEQSQMPTPGQSSKKTLHMPLKIALIGKKGILKNIPSSGAPNPHDDIFEITKRKTKITFQNVSEPPVLSINRNFSAPVELDYRYSDSELLFLAQNDDDLFNKWQACQTFASRQIIRAMNSINRRKKPVWNKAFIELLGRFSADKTIEPDMRNRLITLPSESDIAQSLAKNINPDLIHTARKALSNQIGDFLSDNIQITIDELNLPEKFVSDAKSASKRALANNLLRYGLASSDEKFEKIVLKKFNAAKNMTDKEAAFLMLVKNNSDETIREKALKSFYNKYKSDPIIMDKWFMAQATIPGKATLANIKKLTKHKDFSWTNPNRMRSVIGAFGSGNPTAFHRKDGEGYKFMVDVVKRLDKINPQVAARMLTAFRSWKMVDAERRKLAKAQLQRLQKVKNLSRDVRDILDRTIG